MTMDLATFAVSAALAHALTNLDNLAVLLALLLPVGVARALTGYVAAQAIVLLAALGLAAGAAEVLAGWSGWLGLIPLGLGLWTLWRRIRGAGEGTDLPPPRETPVLSLVALFLGMSLDSFAVMTPLLADSTPAFRLAAVTGAVASVAIMALAALTLSRVTGRARVRVARLETLGPYAMIAAGTYVLLNTGTDMMPG